MKSLGIRCWNDKFSYVILTGTQEEPEEVESNQLNLPNNRSRPQQLAWLRKEIHELLDKHEISIGCFKATEPISRSKDPKRGELEGVVQEAGISHDSQIIIEPRIKSQLNSKTNARKTKYLGELLEIEGLNHLNKTKFEDAIISALSGLPN